MPAPMTRKSAVAGLISAAFCGIVRLAKTSGARRVRPAPCDADAALASSGIAAATLHDAPTVTAPLFDRFLSTPEILEVFEARPFVQAMLDFEAALARAE